MYIDSSLSIPDTRGTRPSVQINEVPSIQRWICTIENAARLGGLCKHEKKFKMHNYNARDVRLEVLSTCGMSKCTIIRI